MTSQNYSPHINMDLKIQKLLSKIHSEKRWISSTSFNSLLSVGKVCQGPQHTGGVQLLGRVIFRTLPPAAWGGHGLIYPVPGWDRTQWKTICFLLHSWEAPVDVLNLINTDTERRTFTFFEPNKEQQNGQVSPEFFSSPFFPPDFPSFSLPLSLSLICTSYLSLRDKRGSKAQAGKSIKIGLIV